MCTAVAFTSFGIQPVRADEEAEEVEPVEEQFEIDEAHFPDENFRKCVAINSDTDGDGWLDNYEIKYTWNLYCENSEVNSVNLDCMYNYNICRRDLSARWGGSRNFNSKKRC